MQCTSTEERASAASTAVSGLGEVRPAASTGRGERRPVREGTGGGGPAGRACSGRACLGLITLLPPPTGAHSSRMMSCR